MACGEEDIHIHSCRCSGSFWKYFDNICQHQIYLYVYTPYILLAQQSYLETLFYKRKEPIYKDTYCIIICDRNKTGNKLNTHEWVK